MAAQIQVAGALIVSRSNYTKPRLTRRDKEFYNIEVIVIMPFRVSSSLFCSHSFTRHANIGSLRQSHFVAPMIILIIRRNSIVSFYSVCFLCRPSSVVYVYAASQSVRL